MVATAIVAASLSVALLTPAVGASDSGPEATFEGPGFAPRIVNGKGTSIRDWPWQVALLDRRFGSSERPIARYFCTGSLIAPDLVVTAAHCVADYRPSALRNLSVVAGRTHLNRGSAGETLGVKRMVMALDGDGRRKFRIRDGAAVWDVALLKLSSRSTAGTPIEIAGSSEKAASQPGRLVKTTGWGYTGGTGGSVSNRLRVATQVILPDTVCRSDGTYYRPATMICLGGPRGGSSACSGDSGGPLVSPVGDGWRLVGLTSFGDAFCRGNIPSVDNRTSSDPIRRWIREKAIALSGVNPVGRGGAIGPLPPSCRVPGLEGKTREAAVAALRGAGCTLGRVRLVGMPSSRTRRVVGVGLPRGWLAPRGFGVSIWLSR